MATLWHVEDLKAAAMADSISAMEELASIAGQQGVFVFDAQLLNISPVIYRHLNARSVPMCPDNETPNDHVRLALLALDILRYSHNRHRGGSSDVLIDLCRKAPIWRWVKFFFEGWIAERYVGNREDADFRVKVWDTVTHFVTEFASALRFRSAVGSVPDLTSMIARMWIKSAEEHYPMDLSNEGLHTIITSFDDKSLSKRKKFWDIFEDPRRNAASHIFETLTRHSRESPVSYVTLYKTTFNILSIISNSEYVFRSSLATGSVKAIALVLSRLTSHKWRAPAGSIDHHATQVCLLRCAEFLERAFQDGPSWIAEALNQHLIISIFKSHEYLALEFVEHRSQGESPRSDLHNIYGNLLDLVITRTLYPSVLREVNRSIATVEARGLSFDENTHSELSDAWDQLKLVAKRRWDWKSYQLSDNKICSSAECPNPVQVPTPTLRKRCCSRCRAVLYCSRECQTADWRAGHRKICDTVVFRRCAGYPESHTSQDLHFIIEAVQFDIAESKAPITTALEDARSRVPETETFIVYLDYRHIPLKHEIVRASEHTRVEDVAEWARLNEDAQSSGKTLVYVTIPSGKAGALGDPAPQGPLAFTLSSKF